MYTLCLTQQVKPLIEFFYPLNLNLNTSIMKKKSLSKSPLLREVQKRKRSRSKSSVKSSAKSRVRARSVKNAKNRRHRSSVQQAGAVRDGSHQRFPRCR